MCPLVSYIAFLLLPSSSSSYVSLGNKSLHWSIELVWMGPDPCKKKGYYWIIEIFKFMQVLHPENEIGKTRASHLFNELIMF